MGENESCEKSALNSPKASSSSSSANMMTMNIISQRTRQNSGENKSGKAKKKRRRESTPEVEILCQVDVTKSFIHKLPSEMLMKILKNLDFQSLLHCRLLSLNWNALATEVCRSRSDLELVFDRHKDTNKIIVIELKRRKTKTRTTTSLGEFVQRFGTSKHFPFARFHFKSVDPHTFSSDSWTNFLSTFGENIKGLKITGSAYLTKNRNPEQESKALMKFKTELRDLLLNQLPKLQEFGLQFHRYHLNPKINYTRLFPRPSENPDPDSDSSSVAKGQQQQLSHLKVLYLEEYMFSVYKEIVTDLLLAAVKLQKIHLFKPELEKYNRKKNLSLLQSLGKLDCLESAEILLTSEFLSNAKGEIPSPSGFKLKTLDLRTGFIYEKPSVWPPATIYLCTLFESNKNTLRGLKISPLGFLENLPLPKFSRLADLVVVKQNPSTIKASIFPPGIELSCIFPALNSLHLEIPWATAFPQEDFVSSIPTLKTLKIVGDDVNDSVIEQISFMCPDLKNFSICDGEEGPLENFPEVGSAMWTHLTKLQSLEISIDVGSEAHVFPALDSCIIGISVAGLERLNDLAEANRLMTKWGIEGRILTTEMTTERENPSVLDLKDLRHLKINLKCRGESSTDGALRNMELMDKAITSISEENAFNLMPNFAYEIKYDYI